MCDVATVQKIAHCLGVNPGKLQLNEEQVSAMALTPKLNDSHGRASIYSLL